MAVPACLRLADDVLPRVRARAARLLVADGWSQTRAAEVLGVTQAMVSKYLSTPARGDEALLERLAEEVVRSAREPAPASGPSAWCGLLSVGEGRAGSEAALEDLLAAERMLRRDPPLRLVPQIGINLARALPGSQAPEEILAFPGRLVEAGGRLVSPAPPAFGGSGHLARALLHFRSRDAALLALASVRGGPDVRHALAPALLELRRRPKEPDTEAPIRRALDGASRVPRFLHDAGGHGIEPCLYVAGPDARGVAAAILELDARLVKP